MGSPGTAAESCVIPGFELDCPMVILPGGQAWQRHHGHTPLNKAMKRGDYWLLGLTISLPGGRWGRLSKQLIWPSKQTTALLSVKQGIDTAYNIATGFNIIESVQKTHNSEPIVYILCALRLTNCTIRNYAFN